MLAASVFDQPSSRCLRRRPEHQKPPGDLHHPEGPAAPGDVGRPGGRSAGALLPADPPRLQHLQKQEQ